MSQSAETCLTTRWVDPCKGVRISIPFLITDINDIYKYNLISMRVERNAALSYAFLADAALYSVIVIASLVQLSRNCWYYRSLTVQKMIHFFMFVGSSSAFIVAFSILFADHSVSSSYNLPRIRRFRLV